ncbi:MAG: LysR family transcriptional regulator [Xanthomonadales bacterium]|jgi:DNA-binding transcriptional LysR family regulator|nr:LysR family transcriptional regulator [Xanthomonadales bacterium]
MNIERLSLDQMRAFALVAELGSFSEAARYLNRAQSAVSYAVATLEKQLGVVVFDRSGYRPSLTTAGRAVLTDIQAILVRTDRLMARTKALARGLESDLDLAVDVLFPFPALIRTLDAFQTAFPTVNLRVFSDALGAVPERVQNNKQALGITVTLSQVPEGLDGFRLADIELVHVAAPAHPLCQQNTPLSDNDLNDHLQLVLTDRSNLTRGQDYGVLARRTWRLSDLWTKHQLLKAGMGWGSMPLSTVAEDLKLKALTQLKLERYPNGQYTLPVHCVHRGDTSLGPAARWLIDWLKSLSY